MKKIEFLRINENKNRLSLANPVEEKYNLLSFFIESNRHPDFIQTDIIEPLEQILKDEKTFEEIQEGYAVWTFADDYCELDVDGKTAYFINGRNIEQNLELPLQEVVDYLKEWKTFLEQ